MNLILIPKITASLCYDGDLQCYSDPICAIQRGIGVCREKICARDGFPTPSRTATGTLLPTLELTVQVRFRSGQATSGIGHLHVLLISR